MKIDNKGFAFSTMLYGLLAVMIILLMLIFSLYKGTSDEAFYYSQTTDVKLNQCVNEEIALEECYRNSNSCSFLAYHACLGIEDDPGIITRKSLYEEVISHAVIGDENGFYLQDDGGYVYKGLASNNYVSYAGKNWLIVEITPSRLIKLVDIEYDEEFAWDNSAGQEWEQSSIYSELNNTYLRSLVNTYDLLVLRKWEIGKVQENAGLADIKNFESSTLSTNEFYVGLLNVSDYAEASRNTNCNLYPLDINTKCNENNYLDSYPSWTMNATMNNANNAYYYNTEQDKILNDSTSSSKKVRPVIYLKSTAEFTSGSGTSTDKYIID